MGNQSNHQNNKSIQHIRNQKLHSIGIDYLFRFLSYVLDYKKWAMFFASFEIISESLPAKSIASSRIIFNRFCAKRSQSVHKCHFLVPKYKFEIMNCSEHHVIFDIHYKFTNNNFEP